MNAPAGPASQRRAVHTPASGEGNGSRAVRSGIFRSFGWSLGGGLLGKIAVMLSTMIGARFLSPREFGVFTGMFATASLAMSFSDLGLNALLTRELAARRLSPRQAIGQVAAYRLRTSPIWLVVMVAGTAVLGRQKPVPAFLIVTFALISLAYIVQAVALVALRGRFLFREAELSVAAGRWLTALISLLALPAFGLGGLKLFALALLAGEILILAIAAALSMIKPAEPVCGQGERILTIRNAWPFGAVALLANAYNRLDVVLFASLSSIEQVGLYAVASRMQDALLLLPAALTTVGLPLFSRAWSGDDPMAEVARLTKFFIVLALILSLPITLVLITFMPQIIRVALGNAYGGAVVPSQILVCFLPFSSVTVLLYTLLAATGHAWETIRPYAYTFITAVSAHLALDWWAGARGASFASLSREPVALVSCLIIARRLVLLKNGRAPGLDRAPLMTEKGA